MLLSHPHILVPGTRSVISPGTKFRSPGNFDNGGIGLGIVAELEKSTTRINRHKISSLVHYNRFMPVEIDLSEEYTCVTKRDGMTKVYYNNEEYEYRKNLRGGDQRLNTPIEQSPVVKKKTKDVIRDSLGFLSWCCLCKKKLQGNDIYMYKGDKGFCSVECRSVKIMEDNLKVQYKWTSIEVLSSPCPGRENSSAGIFSIC